MNIKFNLFDLMCFKDAAVPVKPEPSETKSWNLEDEDSDEEDAEQAQKRKQIKADEEAAEEDPLDAYMKEIYKKKSSGLVHVVSNKKLKADMAKEFSSTATAVETKVEAGVKEETNAEPMEVQTTPGAVAVVEPKKKVVFMTGIAKKKETTSNKGI